MNYGVDVVAALIEHSTNSENFLVQYRSMDKHPNSYPGWLEFPGGKVEPEDVNLVEALYREVKEETGIIALDSKKLCTMEYKFPSGLIHNVHFYVIGSTSYTGLAYGAEGQKIGWLSLYQLITYPKMLPLNRAAALILTTERHPDILE